MGSCFCCFKTDFRFCSILLLFLKNCPRQDFKQVVQDRKAGCGASGKKPPILIDETFGVWVGNLTDADITLEPGELFGFGRGSYEQKEVRAPLRAVFGNLAEPQPQ